MRWPGWSSTCGPRSAEISGRMNASVSGTGTYYWGRMSSYRNGPAIVVLTGTNWKYNEIDITLSQSWYGTQPVGDHAPYPPYGHGAHHTFHYTIITTNDPTTNLYKI
jgi:hypothetical protein